jgi:hypothetical protein
MSLEERDRSFNFDMNLRVLINQQEPIDFSERVKG